MANEIDEQEGFVVIVKNEVSREITEDDIVFAACPCRYTQRGTLES